MMLDALRSMPLGRSSILVASVEEIESAKLPIEGHVYMDEEDFDIIVSPEPAPQFCPYT